MSEIFSPPWVLTPTPDFIQLLRQRSRQRGNKGSPALDVIYKQH